MVQKRKKTANIWEYKVGNNGNFENLVHKFVKNPIAGVADMDEINSCKPSPELPCLHFWNVMDGTIVEKVRIDVISLLKY